MNTRSKARQNLERKEEEAYDVASYLKDLEYLKKQLDSKDKLNAALLEEQENNSKEFETMCKRLSSLKKKISDEETKSSELQEKINTLLQENKAIMIEQEECGNLVRITELNKKLEVKSDELIELQLKYSALLLKSINSSCIKKGFNTYFKKRQNNVKYLMKNRKNNIHKINILIKTKRLMEDELQRREGTIIALQMESEKLLSSIFKYEQDLKNNEVTLGKVSFLEKQLTKLQNIIEHQIGKIKSNETTVTTNDILHAEELTATPKVISKVAENTGNTKRIVSIPKQKINMYSDNHGRGMASKIIKHLPDTFNVINNCKPGNDLSEIIKEGLIETTNDEPIILMIGNFRSLKGDSAVYVSKIDRLARERTSRKIIVTTIVYEQQNFINMHIMNINSKLYTLASLHSNVNVIELNGEQDQKQYSKGLTQKASAKYIATACLLGVNRSNLKTLDEDPTYNTGEMKTASQNFPKSVPLRAVK